MWKCPRLLVAAFIAQPSLATAGQHSRSIPSTEDVDASSMLIRREAQQEMLVPASGQVLPLRDHSNSSPHLAADRGAPLQKRKQPTSKSMAPEQEAAQAAREAALPQQKQQPIGGTPVAAAPAASPAAPAAAEDDPAKHRISKAHLLLLFFLSSLAGLVVVYRQASALFHPRQLELRQEAARSLGRNRGSITKRWSQVINGAKPEDVTRVEESRSSIARQEESRNSVHRSAASQDSAKSVGGEEESRSSTARKGESRRSVLRSAASQDSAKSVGREEESQESRSSEESRRSVSRSAASQDSAKSARGEEDAKSTNGRSVSVSSEVQPPDEAAGGPQISEQPAPPVFQGGN